MSSKQKIATAIAQMLTAVMLAACIPIPVPPYGEGKVDSSTQGRITPGESSREDVLLMLGPPTHRFVHDRFFTYEWAQVVAWVAVPGGGGEAYANRALMIEFGPDDRVTRYREVDSDDLSDRMGEWIEQCSRAMPAKVQQP
jgi:hypothetical protein